MRGKRSKQYRKLMHAYGLSFNFREPYQVLLDAAFVQDAARFKMKLGSMLENTVHGSIKPMITQCCIRHLYDFKYEGAAQKAEKEKWIEVAKQAERRRCGHHELEQPLSTLECLKSVVDPKGSGTNKNRYVIASQDVDVRRAMRGIAGVPIIYINRSVMILEPMAARTEEVREADEVGKRRAGLKGRRGANAGEKRQREEDDDEQKEEIDQQPAPKKNRLKGQKGPNPLSVKKPKKDVQKSTSQKTEDERAAIRKATKSDAQANQKALMADVAVDGEPQQPRKRKRKRKPKEGDVDADDITSAVDDDDGEDDGDM